MKLFLLVIFSLLINANIIAQKGFTHADTLRGSNGPFRERWDVMHYDLTVEPDLVNKTLRGKNIITFFDNGAKLMQIDLMEPMVLDSAINYEAPLSFRREGNVYWLMLRDSNAMYKMRPDTNRITLYFHGKPRESKKAPWDGGWVWKKDSLGRPWATVACQGLGASSWYPCKDWQGDEPDKGSILRIISPDTLVGVGNGRLISRQSLPDNKSMYTWQVVNPINNYNIVPYVGKYVHFGEKYEGEKGDLDLDYWVLDYNLKRAKKQFKEVPRMLKAFEYWFGPYPFYADGFKLVESSHLGMEHQSNIAYGNNYQNGFYGDDLSETGEGLKWDFIIVHEAAHEWFGNNITSKDIADMWIHEGFAHYSEELFMEYHFGKSAATRYILGTRNKIANDIPVTGTYGVNTEGSGDMYYKGAAMIHTIRQIMNDDEKFRQMLRGMNEKFYHQTVTVTDIREFMEQASGLGLKAIFDQYLKTTKVPLLEYKFSRKSLLYRWNNCVAGFDMPVDVSNGKKTIRLYPTANTWKQKKWKNRLVKVDEDYYVKAGKD